MMIRNPELIRNIWLEFTPHRLIAMPAILLILLYLAYILGDSTISKLENIKGASYAIFFALIFLWGARKTADSIVDEVKLRTWDFQRLSAITPWNMTIGKFIGSSLYVWYGAILMLLAYTASLYMLKIEASQFDFSSLNMTNEYIHKSYIIKINTYSNLINSTILIQSLMLLFSGILMLAITMLLAMASLCMNKDKTPYFHIVFYQILGLIVILPFLYFEKKLADIGYYITSSINWFGDSYSLATFSFVSLLIFVFWAIFGIYRLIKKELQYNMMPIAWVSFLIFAVLYSLGFSGLHKHIPVTLTYPIWALAAATYLLIFTESKSIVLNKKLIECYRNKSWRKLLENIPLWLTTYSIIILLSIISLLLLVFFVEEKLVFISLIIIPVMMLSRDIMIVFFFNLSPSKKRADLTAAIYIAILYFVIPPILVALGLTTFAQLLLPLPIAALSPHAEKDFLSLYYIISASILHFIFMGLILKARLNKLKKLN